MRFKIDWASLAVGRKFTVFALFYFAFEGNFRVQAPRPGGGGLIFGGAYFRNFTVFGFDLRNLVFRFNEPRISLNFSNEIRP